MRLVSLTLKNYRQFKDAKVEFGDGVIGIVGLNGAGKSTLVEAVAWALYGNLAARTEKEGIKRSTAPLSASVEVTLEMEISGNPYHITRVLKGTSQIGDASIISSGKVIADSVRGADKEINYLFGMDYKSFYTSFFAKQKELNALTDLTPGQRRDVIIRMLRIDAVDKAIDNLRSAAKAEKLETEVLKKSLKDTNILESEKKAIEINRSKTGKELEKIGSEIKKLEADLAKFREKFNEERKIYEEWNKLDKRLAEAKARLTGLSSRKEELLEERKEVAKLEMELKTLEEASKEFKGLEKKNKEMEIAKESGEKTKGERLADLRKQYKELEENEKKLKPGHPCPTCGQDIKDFSNIKEHFKIEKEQLEEKAKEIKSIKGPYNEKAHKEILSLLDEKRSDAERYPLILARVEKKKTIEFSLKKIKDEIEGFNNIIIRIEAEIKKVPYDEKKHEKITEEQSVTESEHNSMCSRRNEIKLAMGKFETDIKSKQDEIDKVEKSKKEIEERVKKQENRNRMIDIMTDYRTHLISRIRPQLSEIAGRLFAELTAGKYTGIELDEEYNMHIYDGGAKYPIARFSGGESDLANLCLRLAISQLITASSGIEGGFIILDEIFGSQDLIRKSSIMEALARLQKQFRQIILISHVEDIKDKLEDVIEVVESEEGISQVRQ
ncbi:MAG: SMC family ATPase [Candidatus Saganbacteria bacterium]|nr:SMC family ATPase [Candidatus Saganbacteria bacterium]